MIKIAFLSWHFATPQIFLDSIIKMTPGRSGIWKNIQATVNLKEADYYFIMDGYNEILPDAENKAIYFCEHPETPASPGHKTFSGKPALVKLFLHKYLNPGEWWISYDYDYLSALVLPPTKTKKLFVAHTYQTHHDMYHARAKFTAEFIRQYGGFEFDLYGRPREKFEADELLMRRYKGVLGIEKYDALKGEHIIGKDAIADYEYSIEYDVGPCENYFSERFYDALLLWTTPIYFGCQNIEKYIPHKNKAYYMFNQHELTDTNHVYDCIQQPKYWAEIAEVRDLLLNKYQMWAYCHDVVNNIEKYQGS